MYDCGIVLWVPHIALSSRKHLRDAGLVRCIVSSAYAWLGRGSVNTRRRRTVLRNSTSHARSSR